MAKGATFSVTTEEGMITVLGTEFNVKQRDNYFEVICYEGRVKVDYMNETIQELSPGEGVLVLNGIIEQLQNISAINPSWIDNESQFNSTPFVYVLREFERQYDVKFQTNGIDLDQLFTGKFAHDDFLIALKAITLPLDLSYTKDKNTVTLISEQN